MNVTVKGSDLFGKVITIKNIGTLGTVLADPPMNTVYINEEYGAPVPQLLKFADDGNGNITASY